MKTKKPIPENLYAEEISLLAEEDLEVYVRLNLRRIQEYRRKFDLPVIAIAGAEGKTTTKRMLAGILKPSLKILETPPNCSTAFGITATLLKLDNTHRAALLELGIVKTHQFQQAIEIAEPTIAVVTNIGDAHLASLGNKYLIADAKTELIRKLPKNGIAVLNIDDDLVSSLANFSPTPRIIKFGLNTNAQFYASNIRYLGPEGITFDVNSYYRFHLPIYSSTAIYNALTAIATARALGIDFHEIQEGLQHRFSLPRHRGNLIVEDGFFILDYTYDATINSVTKELEALIQFKPFARRLVLVIGDMTYPGPNSQLQHEKFGYIVAASPIDVIVTVGKQAKHIARGVNRMNHSGKIVLSVNRPEELATVLPKFIEPHTCMLLTGGKSLNLKTSLKDIFQPKSYATESESTTA